jgi:TonB family protein
MVVTLLVEFRLAKSRETTSGPVDSDYYYKNPQDPLQDDFAKGAYWIGAQGLVAPVLSASVLPKYTAQAMRDKIQGDVIVEVIVNPDGSVGKTRVAISLDPIDGLDANALDAAQQYRFVPGTLNGQPVPVLVTLSLSFRLH